MNEFLDDHREMGLGEKRCKIQKLGNFVVGELVCKFANIKHPIMFLLLLVLNWLSPGSFVLGSQLVVPDLGAHSANFASIDTLIPSQKFGKWGYTDSKGQFIIPPK